MRKVLFATTALVALGGVSAASADISVTATNSSSTSWTTLVAQTQLKIVTSTLRLMFGISASLQYSTMA